MGFVVHPVILSILFSQRLLPIDGANDLFFQPPPLTPTSKVYTIRPYFPKDEVTALTLITFVVSDALPFVATVVILLSPLFP